MQMRKYYGRSLAGALARVKRELGDDALIIESRTVKPGSPEADANPGMRFEILAARDDDSARVQRIESARPASPARPRSAAWPAAPAQPEPARNMRQSSRSEPQPSRSATQPSRIPLAQLNADPAERWAATAAMATPDRAVRPAQPDPEPLHPLLRATIRPQANPLSQPRRMPATQHPSASPPTAARPAAPKLSHREQLAQALAQAKQRPSDQSPSASQADPQASPAALQPARGSHLLRDLAELKSQLRTLLDEVPGPGGVHPATDIHEFHDMIEFGIDHRLLAPIFRTWLQWRSSPQTMRRYLAGDPASPAARMRGESLREWFCHAWTASLTFDTAPGTPANGPEILALIGPTGSGKTTTLAKIASKFRLDNRQNNAIILSLDTHRLDAANQWKQISACLGVPSRTLATQEDAMIWAERIHDYDWVGIDTPGSFAPDSPAGRVYGSLLAQCNQLKTVLTLPATHHDSANRRHLTWAQSLNARHVLFTKLDETDRLGGIVNLTMDHPLALTGFSTGTRVPSDWTMADAHACWHNVLAPADNTVLEIAS